MKAEMFRRIAKGFLVLALLLSATNLMVLSQDAAPTPQYFSAETLVFDDGVTIEKTVISGPPTPPAGYERHPAALSALSPEAKVTVPGNVPAFDWSYGCSATSAAMIAGYYDRTSYPNMYTGPTNGGVMPLDNSAWGYMSGECPLSASHKGVDGRLIRGHVDDYWISYLSGLPDPFITGGWPEHTYGDCTGDYMKTNQSTYGNDDGSTTFYNFTNGMPLYDYQMESYGIHTIDGGYGFKLFYESRGYTVNTMYNQYINPYHSNGFTYDQYKAEIDAGRPVMIHVTGHTMVGYGYDDSSNTIYIHDTWDYSEHAMTWGGSYYGMDHVGVTIVQLDAPTAEDLARFEARPQGQAIHLEWETTAEVDNRGFNLYRSPSPDGERLRLNGVLIPSQVPGQLLGALYTWLDEGVRPGLTYYYWLEDVAVGGATTLHGPVEASVLARRLLAPIRARPAPGPVIETRR